MENEVLVSEKPSKKVSYSTALGNKKFDWDEFLSRKTYTKEELEEAVILSHNWVTCACGEQCKSLRRNQEGVPADETLRTLGVDFWGAISNLNRYHVYSDMVEINRIYAKGILKDIEKRAAYLLAK